MTIMTTPIEVDGAMGEGGGQVLRSALSLSLLTGQAFRISRIRANRQRSGLRPQHLAAVQAAARVCGAEIRGDRLGSDEITFDPGPVRPGYYCFDIGTAGATSLVLQTLLLPLALAPGTSRVTIRGGTHVPWSPCFHYLDRQWRPFLARMGVALELTMTLAGFYPQGGGELQAQIAGSARPKPLRLADQLLLPLAVADGPSELRTSEVTTHLVTNADVIRLFLPVEIGVDGPLGGSANVRVRPGPDRASRHTQTTEAQCYAGT